ncbi:MAG: hypothetical protein SF029_12395 [bacterium]|nr:hypothetical protein [bacterium]
MASYVQHIVSASNRYILNRHWSAASEPYTGADALFSAVDQGWQLSPVVFVEHVTLETRRTVPVFHFVLVRAGDTCRMAVIYSPHVDNYVQIKGLKVFALHREIHKLSEAPHTPPLETKTVEVPAVAAVG